MRLRKGNANLFRLCRSRLRTMTFDFHACCFIDHLHCCLSVQSITYTSSIHPSIYATRAPSTIDPAATILSQEFNRTHSQIFPAAHLHTSQRSFSFRFIFALVLVIWSSAHYFACMYTSALIHLRLRCTLLLAGFY